MSVCSVCSGEWCEPWWCQLEVTCSLFTVWTPALLCSLCSGRQSGAVAAPPKIYSSFSITRCHTRTTYHTVNTPAVTLNHHHGHTHKCRPGGLHPHGEDQHGGVHQEPENKVRSWWLVVYSVWVRVELCKTSPTVRLRQGGSLWFQSIDKTKSVKTVKTVETWLAPVLSLEVKCCQSDSVCVSAFKWLWYISSATTDLQSWL